MDEWGLGDIDDGLDWGDSGGGGLSWDDETAGIGKKKAKRLTAGRVVWCVFVGIFFSAALAFLTLVLYIRLIKYPSQEEVVWETTGMYCLNNWIPPLQSLDSTGEDSYLHREIEYANGNQNKIDFYKKMCSTISYAPKTVVANNVFGNPMINRETDEVVYIDSYVWQDEPVYFSYIDYTALDFKDYGSEIKFLLEENGVSYGCVDYENKLVDVFLQFMLGMSSDQLPIKTVERVPNIQENIDLDTGEIYYSVMSLEDEYIDRLLFSSNDFRDCLDRFSSEAARQSGHKGRLQETDAYKAWNKSENKDNELRPSQYNYKECINKTWCGVYYLLNEYIPEGSSTVSPVLAEVGDGSIENPAGLNTDMVTSIYFSEYDELGNIINYRSCPIRVTLKEYGFSQDAINYFENKDNRNRGINIKSELQYCYFVFEVTNLSDEVLEIPSNMGLCDKNGNVQARTGVIYGLNETCTLNPDETGIIETWQSSTELYKKYMVWGADFARREEPVWFRVLAGNLEDTSQYKGVWVEGSSENVDYEKSVSE